MSAGRVRNSAAWGATLIVIALSFVIAPLLPKEERKAWPWQEWARNSAIQTLNAYLHAVAALVLWMLGLVATVKHFGDLYTAALMDPHGGTGDAAYLSWYGMIGFFSWMVSPLGLLSGLYLIDSVARAVGGAMTGSVPGSFFLWVPCLFWRRLTRLGMEAALTARYGPADLPLRIEKRGNMLFVRASRSRDDWHDLLTFSYGDEFFKLVWRGEVAAGGGRNCFEYRMEPWPGAEPVRKILLLDPERHRANQ